MMYLLDANLLIALCMPEHVHHEDAMRWLASLGETAREQPTLALCAITEGALGASDVARQSGCGTCQCDRPADRGQGLARVPVLGR